jgi:hypothetical protein
MLTSRKEIFVVQNRDVAAYASGQHWTLDGGELSTPFNILGLIW